MSEALPNSNGAAIPEVYSSAHGWPLRWEVADLDDDGNTTWEAAGGYVSEEDGPAFYYRIKQGLKSNTHVFIEASDGELLNVDEDDPRWWHNLGEAKAAMQRDHDEVMRSFLDPANK